MTRLRIAALVALCLAGAAVGCSGGGGNSAPGPDRTASASVPNVAGTISIPLDQKVSFTVVIPSPAPVAPASIKFKSHKQSQALYISPKTGSVVVQIQTVNGRPLATPPASNPAANVPASCTNGCTLAPYTVAGAVGINGYFIQTFTGPNGTGTLISAGFIYVTLPSAAGVPLPGTTLSIGGYASDVNLGLVPGASLVEGTATTANLSVNAIDPAGAVIIGAETLIGSGISLSFPDSNLGALTFAGGASSLTLQQALNIVPLSYNGAFLPQVTVIASLVRADGSTLTEPVAIAIATPAPTPTPTAAPTPPSANGGPLSLYVIDAMGNNVLEFSGLRAIEGGTAPNPMESPRRVLNLAVPVAGASPNPCTPAGIAVASDATMYVATSCYDASGNAQTLAYAGSVAQAGAVPPTPSAVLALDGGTFAAPYAVQIDRANPYHVFEAAPDLMFGQPEFFRFTPSSSKSPDLHIGDTCLKTLQFGAAPKSCDPNDPTTLYVGYVNSNFAIDPSGVIDVGLAYTYNAPEPAASQGPTNQSLVAAYDGTAANSAPNPINALSGLPTQLGSSGGGTAAFVAIDAGQLYVLATGQTDGLVPNGTGTPDNVNPGLSACVGPPDNHVAVKCADGNPHAYLMRYPASTLNVASGQNGDIGTAPDFIIGGDGLPGSGAAGFDWNSYYTTAGNLLTVVDGFAYVLNPGPPVASVPPGSVGPPEIDIYDLRFVSGVTLSVGPVGKIVLSNSAGSAYALPVGLAVGPTGSATGGPALFSHSMAQIKSRYQMMRQQRDRLRLQRRFNLRF